MLLFLIYSSICAAICASRSINLIDVNAKIENGILSFDDMVMNGKKMDFGTNGVTTFETGSKTKSSKVEHPQLVKSIDKSVDPCDNFYNFVCNGFKRNTPIPDDSTLIAQTQTMTEAINKQLKRYLSSSFAAQDREQEMMTIYYDKCLEQRKDPNPDGMRRLLDKMKHVQMNAAYFTDWLLLMNPTSAFYEVHVLPDEFNSTINSLNIVPSSPLGTFSTYFDPAYANEYVATRKLLYDFLTMLSNDDVHNEIFRNDETEKWRRVESFIKVDQTLAKIQEETEFDSEPMSVSIFELNKLMPSVNWDLYLNHILPFNVKNYIYLQPIGIKQVMTMARYEQLLNNIDLQILFDYLDWKIIFHYQEFLGKKYADMLGKHTEILFEIKSRNDEETCADQTISAFADVMGSLWLKDHFNHDNIEVVDRLVKKLKDAFLVLLETNTWMDDYTKERARTKAHKMISFIGFDPKFYSEQAIQQRYKMLSFDNFTSFYDITQRITYWMQQYSYTKLNSYNNRETFEASATEVNAFYDPNQNQIAILAGILNEPFFNPKWPDIMNIAGIGMVIGHEITHGFDDRGAYFDEYGNRANWWNKNTMPHFNEKTKCIENQYSKIEIAEGVMVNGRRTQGENIADNGGMRAAIRAALNGSLPSFQVLGLEDYTPDQIFFMTYAFTSCENMRPQALLSEVAVESHAPSITRVNVVLANQPQFAQSFNCPRETHMNPVDKCTVW